MSKAPLSSSSPAALKSRLRSLRDQYSDLRDQWSYVCHAIGDILTGEEQLEGEASDGLAVFVYSLGDQIRAFDRQLSEIHQSPHERFASLAYRCPVVARYYDESKNMLKIEQVWKDFESKSIREQTMLTFLIMVWNPVEHVYPPVHAFSVLREVQHLEPMEKELILEWIANPFTVMDDKGNLNE